MEIEMINKNRIKITFNSIFLKENNIDIHSFMSNSKASQKLILTMLDKAQNDFGFDTDNYKLSIQTIALSDGNFIITVTRIAEKEKSISRVHVRKKENTSLFSIYKFENIESINSFKNFIRHLNLTIDDKNNYFYQFENNLFFLHEQNNIDKSQKISNIICDFATQISNSDTLFSKIKECGKEITFS